jgi:hypothetical protein
MILLTLYSKTWGFGFKARGLQDMCHQQLKDKDRRLNIELTLILIL